MWANQYYQEIDFFSDRAESFHSKQQTEVSKILSQKTNRNYTAFGCLYEGIRLTVEEVPHWGTDGCLGKSGAFTQGSIGSLGAVILENRQFAIGQRHQYLAISHF